MGKTMNALLGSVSLILVVTAPVAAFAYVGPGAGLSLLGALWALLVALAAAVFFAIAWPVRRMLRKRQAEQASGKDASLGNTVSRSN
jgi:hypothetical protein